MSESKATAKSRVKQLEVALGESRMQTVYLLQALLDLVDEHEIKNWELPIRLPEHVWRQVTIHD